MAKPNLAERMNRGQARAAQILEEALEAHRRAVDRPEVISAGLKRRICHFFALRLKDEIVKES